MPLLKLLVVIFCLASTSIAVTHGVIPASKAHSQEPAVSLTPGGFPALRAIADLARNEDLRWPDFAPYKAEFGRFYEANGSSLAWVQNGQVRPQALSVIEVLKNAN